MNSYRRSQIHSFSSPVHGEGKSNEDGYALVLVIWGMTLLSLIAAALLGETRSASHLASARIAEAQAGLLAQAGIERALVAIDAPASDASWPENGAPALWDFAGGRIAISIEDEGGKVDAFEAPDLMLDAVLARAGLGDGERRIVEREIRSARAEAIFSGSLIKIASLDDLRGITSLSAANIERLRPMLTLRSGMAGFDPQIAAAETLRAVPGSEASMIENYLRARGAGVLRADAPDRPPSPAPAFTIRSPRAAFTIRSEACTSDGHLAIREALIRRDAPGKFARLELREPIEPRFWPQGCAPSRKSPSTQS